LSAVSIEVQLPPQQAMPVPQDVSSATTWHAPPPTQTWHSGQLTGVCAQTPDWHAPVMHGSPVSQAVPFATLLCPQVPSELQTVVVHWLPSSLQSLTEQQLPDGMQRSLHAFKPEEQAQIWRPETVLQTAPSMHSPSLRQLEPGARLVAAAFADSLSPSAIAAAPSADLSSPRRDDPAAIPRANRSKRASSTDSPPCSSNGQF